jgi:NADH:ubiquinone oxidoreductase subunit C
MLNKENKLFLFSNSLITKVPKVIDNIFIVKDCIILIASIEHLEFLLNYLKHNVATQYNILVDITVIDRFSQKNRFEVCYFLRSILYNNFLIIKIYNDGFTPIPSSTEFYKGANWLEREVWDMFGVFFSNHSDLRRILTDYGFQGFPLRKDFPLTGFIEVRYDDEQKRVIYEFLELSQEFRFFDFQSPWQNSEFLKIRR